MYCEYFQKMYGQWTIEGALAMIYKNKNIIKALQCCSKFEIPILFSNYN